MSKVKMRKFIIREDTVSKLREILQDCEKRLHNPTAITSVLHDFDTGLCTLSPYMPTHLDLGNEDCCGIFMGIGDRNMVICNECEKSIKDAIDQYSISLLSHRGERKI